MALLWCLLALGGCVVHQAPDIMYSEKIPINDTAVFASFDRTLSTGGPQIELVDGKKTSCAEVGCPRWVRVLPGKHVFYIRDSHFGGPGSFSTFQTFTIELEDMKPRHVYVPHYQQYGGRISNWTVEDLGENPDFGITIGREGVNQKYYPVKF